MRLRNFTAFLLLALASTAGVAGEFTYTTLVDLINSQKIQSIDELIPQLPLAMRANYTLMYDSKSLQGSSYSFPRAILFGHDGKLTCTFNGDPSQKGYDDLECFQFHDDTRSFEFRNIEFPSKSNGLLKPKFFEANQSPFKQIHCTDCHRADPRPNWEQYPVWPGAYGSHDDMVLLPVDEKKVTPDEKAMVFERTHFIDFLETNRLKGRYASLTHEPEQRETPFLLDRALLKNPGLDFMDTPNIRFTDMVTRLVAKRDARLLHEASKTSQYAFLLSVACEGTYGGDPHVQQIQKVLAPLKANTSLVDDSDRLLQAAGFDVRNWTPLFRSFDPDCTDCVTQKYPKEILLHYDYEDGIETLKYLVAPELVSLISENQDPALEKLMSAHLYHQDQNAGYVAYDPAAGSFLKDMDDVGLALHPVDPYEKNPFCETLLSRFEESQRHE